MMEFAHRVQPVGPINIVQDVWAYQLAPALSVHAVRGLTRSDAVECLLAPAQHAIRVITAQAEAVARQDAHLEITVLLVPSHRLCVLWGRTVQTHLHRLRVHLRTTVRQDQLHKPSVLLEATAPIHQPRQRARQGIIVRLALWRRLCVLWGISA